jgi:hypothetical protein
MKFGGIIRALGDLVSRYQVEIYVTMIFHLCAAIALMCLTLDRSVHPASMEIVLESFSDEEVKMLEALQHEKEQLEREVALVARRNYEQLRNTAVDEAWEESGGGERNRLLAEHDELQAKLSATRQMLNHAEPERGKALNGGDIPLQNRRREVNADKKSEKEKRYAGPSVMSYRLTGRKAFVLPVPVYLCEKGGEVVVSIVVAGDGSVAAAGVDGKKSAADPCIRESARQAALLSRFSVSESSKSQQGSITYRFIPQ